MSRPQNSPENFWRRVAVASESECWLWTGGKSRTGYGQTTFNYQHRLAHRVSWELTHGEIPDGMMVCHRCDNPACCNPEHLFIGSNSDNQLDSVLKGRSRAARQNGSTNHCARLTESQVIEIRRRRTSGEKGIDLAREFGVSQSALCQAYKGTTWGHL